MYVISLIINLILWLQLLVVSLTPSNILSQFGWGPQTPKFILISPFAISLFIAILTLVKRKKAPNKKLFFGVQILSWGYIIIPSIVMGLIFGEYFWSLSKGKTPASEIAYQKVQDPRRISDINQIANIAINYDKKVGYPPLLDIVQEHMKPVMVLIGRSDKEEDYFATVEALKRGALFINSSRFENILSQGLDQSISLPRDPQKIPTYAPNIYIYYINEEQFCVVAHLFFKSDKSKEYTWEGGTFNSHANCYSKNK